MSGTRVPSGPGPQYDQKWMYWFWDWVKANRITAGTYGGTGVSLQLTVDAQGRVTAIATAT